MIKKLDHVGIKVSNMQKSLEFYRDTLGFKLAGQRRISEDLELAFLYLEGQPDMEIELVCGSGQVDRVGVVNHLALAAEDIEYTLKILEQKGLEIVDKIPRVIGDGTKIAFLWGPDGEKLELVQKP